MQKSDCFYSVRAAVLRRGFLLMKLSLLFLLIGLQLSATNYAQQRINLDAKDLTVLEILGRIEKSSPYEFSYSNDVIPVDKVISIKVINAKIDEVMAKLFEDYPLRWKVVKSTNVVISPVNEVILMKPSGTAEMVKGKVFNDNGETIAGASVVIKGSTIGTTTLTDGSFSINANKGDILVISSVGYEQREIEIGDELNIEVQLTTTIEFGEEVVTVGYVTQRKATVTGSVVTVSGDDLVKSPVTNLSNSLDLFHNSKL